MQTLRRRREAYRWDERILGRSALVEQVRRQVEAPAPRHRLTPEQLVARVCRHIRVTPESLAGRSRTLVATRARGGIAYLWTEGLGRPGRALMTLLGARSQSVYRAAKRGQKAHAEWIQLLKG